MAITKAQMRMLQRRKTSDLDRLSQQYKKNVESMTGEYESDFKSYNQRVAEQMAPYESELAKYRTEVQPGYEAQVAAYQKKLDDYKAQLADIEKSPSEMVNAPVRTAGRSGKLYTIDGREYGERNLPEGYFIDSVVTGTAENKNRSGRVISTREVTEDRLFRSKKAPTFNEKAPEAPKAPVMPETEKFDTSRFEQRKAALETDYRREVGERRSGRMAAVSRRSNRSMLRGA